MPSNTPPAEVRRLLYQLSADAAVARSGRRKPVHRQFVRLAARRPFRPCVIDSTMKLELNYGKTLAGANADWNDVDLWDVGSGELRRRLTGHRNRPVALAWAPDGHTLATGGADRTVRLWGDTGAFLGELKDGARAEVVDLAWLDGRTLATFSKDDRLGVWDVDRRLRVRDVRLPTRGQARFSPAAHST